MKTLVMRSRLLQRTSSFARKLIPLLLLIFSLPASFLAAQQVQEFTGRVTDPSGAVLPKATVIAHNVDSGVDTSTITTSTGNYTIPYLIPGHYSISATVPGFETGVRTGLTLQVDQAATVNFALKVGSTTETVTVNADSLLDTAKADNGVVIENTRVTELPLNGRNVGMLAVLAPGALFEGDSEYTRAFDSDDQYMSVNGGGQGGVALQLDGLSNSTSPINNGGAAEIAYAPLIDSVQEYKIVTNPYDAQYGLMAGAVEDVTLKTGTSKFHGDVYEFARRQWLDANWWQNDWFIKEAAPGTNVSQFATPQMKWDQYGAEADGPVKLPWHKGQPKTFFTMQYEKFQETQPDPQTASVPSPQWLNGDFSNLTYWDGSKYDPKIIYDPLSNSCSNNPGAKNCPTGEWLRQTFGSNVIPAPRINPYAQAILNLYPAPNVTPPQGADQFTNNYFMEGADAIRYRNVLAKLDRNWSDKDRSTLTYGYWDRVELRNGNGLTGPPETGWAPLGERQHSFTFRHTHTFSSYLIFDFRANVQARDDFTYTGAAFNPSTLFGWSSGLIAAMGSSGTAEFPALNFSNNNSMGTNSNSNTVKDSLNMFPTITWVEKKHTIHAGLDLRFWQTDYDVVGGGANFYTDDTWTQIQCGSCAGNETYQSSGNDIAAFLLGVPTSGGDSISSQGFWSAHYYAPFVQDDWKVTKRLTLNLGIRWDFLPAETERHNRSDYAFDTTAVNPINSQISVPGYSQILGGITFLGVNGNPRQAYSLTKTNFQPRVGFAYSINDKTVLRGGFGNSTRSPQNAPNNAGFSSSTSYLSSDPTYPSGVMPNMAAQINNPFPQSLVQPTYSSLGMLTQLGQGPFFLNPKYRTPHFWNYSLGVERQLSGHDMVNISYVGTRLYGGDNGDNINHWSASAIEALNCNPNSGGEWENCNNYNVPNPFQGNAAFQGTSDYYDSTLSGFTFTQPFPEFGGITEWQLNTSHTWYNSLQVVADHRLSQGLVLHGTWTWSKLMDSGGWTDQTFRIPYRQLDGNDHSHVITISGVYNLPIGRGHAILPHMNRVLDTAIGGWEIGSLFTLESGSPWSLGYKYMLHDPYVHPHIQKDDGYIREVAACVEQWVDSTNSLGQPVYTMQQLQYDYDGTCSKGADMENVGSWMPIPNNVFQGVRLLRNDDLDVNLSKNFALAEGFHLQMRMEAFNAPNHPLWSYGPDGTIQDSTFGEILKGPWGQSNTPRQLQLSAKVVW